MKRWTKRMKEKMMERNEEKSNRVIIEDKKK